MNKKRKINNLQLTYWKSWLVIETYCSVRSVFSNCWANNDQERKDSRLNEYYIDRFNWYFVPFVRNINSFIISYLKEKNLNGTSWKSNLSLRNFIFFLMLISNVKQRATCWTKKNEERTKLSSRPRCFCRSEEKIREIVCNAITIGPPME